MQLDSKDIDAYGLVESGGVAYVYLVLAERANPSGMVDLFSGSSWFN